MKTPIGLITLCCFVFLSLSTSAQIDVGKKLKKVEKKVEKEVDKTIDKGLDEAEKTVKEGVSKDKEKKTAKDEKRKPEVSNQKTAKDTSVTKSSGQKLKAWSKYDFVSGDKIIFEDNLVGEQNGEFPSKWDLVKGNAENAVFGGENVVSFVQTNTEIRPLMKTANYLPELFTIEFDVYFYNKYNEAYTLRLKNVKSIDIRTHRVSMGSYSGSPEVPPQEPGWHHIALSFDKRAMKVYFDQDRLLNIPNLKDKPTEFSISALSHGAKAGDPALLRNIRIAEGGVKLYARFLTEGKIVTRGILFESGKAVIKPESMGVINEIVALMKDHPEVNFRIEGHTDSDGDDAFNQKLSDERAEAVKTEFVKLGINSSRMQTKGWGESKPVDGNATPEGKANNRRVEFVKM
jgi:outer membrane protein OmpA-like peptidoglycan-associated protein